MLTKKYFYLTFLLLPLMLALSGCSRPAKTAKTESSSSTSSVKATADSGAIKMFGTPIDTATRSSLRKTLVKAGLIVTKLNSTLFCDEYKVNGKIKKAKQLEVCYTSGNKFAKAAYIFPSFMNSKLVNYVVDMVKSKYGAPSSYKGNAKLGNVRAKWDLGTDAIVVYRGWPNTTVYFYLVNKHNYIKMAQEAQKVEEQKKLSVYKSESKAF